MKKASVEDTSYIALIEGSLTRRVFFSLTIRRVFLTRQWLDLIQANGCYQHHVPKLVFPGWLAGLRRFQHEECRIQSHHYKADCLSPGRSTCGAHSLRSTQSTKCCKRPQDHGHNDRHQVHLQQERFHWDWKLAPTWLGRAHNLHC